MKCYLNLVSERTDVVTCGMNIIDTVSFGMAGEEVKCDKGLYEVRPGDSLIKILFLDGSEDVFRADKWSIYFSEEYPPFKK